MPTNPPLRRKAISDRLTVLYSIVLPELYMVGYLGTRSGVNSIDKRARQEGLRM